MWWGNAAYQGGNIGGGTLGLEALLGTKFLNLYPFIIGFLAFTLLYIGNYKIIERVFIGLVLVMSLSFLISAILVKPNFSQVFKGLFLFRMPEDGILSVIGLVGTTVVPYNLFLHAALVSEKWKSIDDLPSAKRDTLISIILGGVVSMAIMISAAAIPDGQITGVLDLAKGLKPLYGDTGKVCGRYWSFRRRGYFSNYSTFGCSLCGQKLLWLAGRAQGA